MKLVLYLTFHEHQEGVAPCSVSFSFVIVTFDTDANVSLGFNVLLENGVVSRLVMFCPSEDDVELILLAMKVSLVFSCRVESFRIKQDAYCEHLYSFPLEQESTNEYPRSSVKQHNPSKQA
jgi:hypothetical protein